MEFVMRPNVNRMRIRDMGLPQVIIYYLDQDHPRRSLFLRSGAA